ncbi:CPBP family intramembrane metalloprotease [Candidatus Gracilibacteria bacterium]|jgi:membrane protease YdiL (CAAX protease family)|nr:CPBP family intramembrane metalloprotease [Candidatus Gracilibacteria bacterium]
MKNIFASGKIKGLEIAKLSLGGYLLYMGINFIASMLIVFGGLKIYGWQIGERILPFVDKNILNLASNYNIAIIAFVIAFIIPLIEEIIFRGLLLNYLIEKTNIHSKIVVILSAVIYALLMATLFSNFSKILPIFVFGLIASAITIKAKSLYPAIILHVLNNLIGIIIEIFLFKL